MGRFINSSGYYDWIFEWEFWSYREKEDIKIDFKIDIDSNVVNLNKMYILLPPNR